MLQLLFKLFSHVQIIKIIKIKIVTENRTHTSTHVLDGFLSLIPSEGGAVYEVTPFVLCLTSLPRNPAPHLELNSTVSPTNAGVKPCGIC